MATIRAIGSARRGRGAARQWGALLIVGLSGSCGSLHTSDPPRTATEDFLLRTAAAQAVVGLDSQALAHHTVYVDSSRLKTYVFKNNQLTEQDPSPEHKTLAGEVRAGLLRGGARLVESPDKAEAVVELWSAGVGIDSYHTVVGVPSLYFTGFEGLVDAQFLTRTPEVVVFSSQHGLGVAGVAYAAYWKKTGELIALSNPPEGFGQRKDMRYFILFEKQVGNIPTINRRPQ